MKKSLLSLLAVAATLTTQAADYGYLTFELTDGQKTSVPATTLTITISGTTLTAGEKSFTLDNLSKMYFSVSDETTGIASVTAEQLGQATDIYDLNGRRYSPSQALPKGTYIIRTAQGSHKVVVK